MSVISSANYQVTIKVLLLTISVIAFIALCKFSWSYKKLDGVVEDGKKMIKVESLEINGNDKYIYTTYSDVVTLGGVVAINYKGMFWKDRMCLGKITDMQNEKDSKLVQIQVIYVFPKYKDDFSEAMRHNNKGIIDNMIVLTSIKDQDISQIATGGQV